MLDVKNSLSDKVSDFYKSNYEILRTPDFCEDSRLLKSGNGKKYIGATVNKRCRFCGRDEQEVTFDLIAHAFPECIGNHVLVSNYECDDCNTFFGKTIENDYGKFFDLYHSIMHIKGKNGYKKCKFKVSCDKRRDDCMDDCISIVFDNIRPIIKKCKFVSDEYICLKEQSIIISKPVGSCNPIGIYKALVKMALSIMPFEEIDVFSHTIEWLIAKEHSNFYHGRKKLLTRYQFIPGFNVTKYPYYVLYRRKRTVWNLPYMLFNLTYGCFSLLIQVPKDETETDDMFRSIPFPPNQFFTTTEGCWDFTEQTLPKGYKNNITLSFDSLEEVT